jgi:Recombinase
MRFKDIEVTFSSDGSIRPERVSRCRRAIKPTAYSLRDTAAALNNQQVPSPDGFRWQAKTVKQIITWGIPDIAHYSTIDRNGRTLNLVMERVTNPRTGEPAVVTYFDEEDRN